MDFQQIAYGLNVEPLRAALAAKPHLFGQHSARVCGASPHRSVTDIWVRYNDIANLGPNFNDEHDAVWYPAYAELPELTPILFALVGYVQGERLGGVLITKLPPGGEILPHVDSGWHAGYYDKFYIPVQNDPGALFRFPSGDLIATPGEVYHFNNDIPHSVDNRSMSDRIALIVCIKTDKYKDAA